MKLKDKIAIITGAASGIGYAVAKEMAKEGATIIVADINFEQAQKAAQNINEYGKAFAHSVDVRDAEAVKKLVDDVAEQHGRIDYMFNNAGIAIMGEMMEMSLEQWNRLFDINVRGVIYGTHAACNVMKKQGFGHIVNTASLAGIIPSPNLGAYSGTKHAVLGICKSLRIEAREFGIKVSAICPGVIDTPMVTDSEMINEEQLAVSREEIRENIQLTPYPVEKAARVIVKGVKKNKGIILITGHAHILSRLYRFFPGLSELIGRSYYKREKNIFAKKK
ncbi:SDR family NAD(P)-dependent oxidoreductase [Candidatus Uabimicrobium amorphum]|uniref:Short-chain dehydrogenase n=1 Tax=Uabimicrobium amorphum TaxID=2596890 RepID=A0A5S9IRX2_UABAM|nr:SDR family NAD(P)-dependent oxidoreductase [Candidatus Uabimicrobium amorphum]BBM86784.1 short-chain dehydrogenase [Candidatus Uabimicrobium amorphum]